MTDTEIDYIYCKKCGNEYDWYNQKPPEDATFYWVASCPICNAKMTANPVDTYWMEIINDNLEKVDDWEYWRGKIHAQSRLWHGRLAGYTVEELIERAKYFDRRARHEVWGPDPYHDIGFRLRKQAREKLKE